MVAIKRQRQKKQKIVGSSPDRRSGKTKDYEIGFYCFCVKHPALRRKSKDWLALNVRVGRHVYPRTESELFR